ncbi:MAG: TonB-dependent receptor, partial [Pseudomonadales bacterium]|nr:TonB-dependent receptor [Pseudomonadales bacterium]
IRLISTESTPLSWTLGLYALRLTEDGTQLDRYSGDTLRELTSSYRSTNSALYGEVSREVATETTLSVGARLERRDVRYDDSDGESLAPGETMWGATVTALHRLGAGRSLYLSVSRGYKAGGFNLGAAIPSERREFSAEYLESAEVGLKAQDDDRRLRGSLALFWMERREQQVENSTQIVPGDPLSFVYYTDNAARGRNLGLEAAVDWQATRRWSIGGSLGLLRATYLEYVTAGRDLSGRDQPHAPRYQFASYAAYRHPHGWFARIDVSGRDEFYFAASHDERSRAYTVTNLKVGLEWRAATIEFWARNLFDRAYSQRGFSFGNEPPDFPVRLYTQAADPRQIGVTLHYAWD